VATTWRSRSEGSESSGHVNVVSQLLLVSIRHVGRGNYITWQMFRIGFWRHHYRPMIFGLFELSHHYPWRVVEPHPGRALSKAEIHQVRRRRSFEAEPILLTATWANPSVTTGGQQSPARLFSVYLGFPSLFKTTSQPNRYRGNLDLIILDLSCHETAKRYPAPFQNVHKIKSIVRKAENKSRYWRSFQISIRLDSFIFLLTIIETSSAET